MSSDATIFERMSAILSELPPIGKNQRNEQQNFMFRGHDDVLNALNPLLAKHGVLIVPDVLERVVSQRTTSRGSIMFEVNLHVSYTFYGSSGDTIMGSAWGEGTDMGDKATSKAMTMAFKSMLNQAFAISNKEVADADATSAEESVIRDVMQSRDNKLDVPRNWGQIQALVGPYGTGLDWQVWTRQASLHLYNEADSTKLTKEQRSAMLKVSAGAIHALVLAHPSSEFPPPERLEVAKAWASVLDGHMLDGPEHRLSPDETDLPLEATMDEEIAQLADEAITGPPS